MKQVQKTSTAELKREAVRLARTSGKPIAQVARELGDLYSFPPFHSMLRPLSVYLA